MTFKSEVGAATFSRSPLLPPSLSSPSSWAFGSFLIAQPAHRLKQRKRSLPRCKKESRRGPQIMQRKKKETKKWLCIGLSTNESPDRQIEILSRVIESLRFAKTPASRS